MSRPTREYLRHILDEAEYLIRVSQGLSKAAFLASETLRRAFVRSLEIIGEAATNVPDSVRAAHPEVDRRRMAECVTASSTPTSSSTMTLSGMSSPRRYRRS
jgi:uncharacterized protein with HEPN domain